MPWLPFLDNVLLFVVAAFATALNAVAGGGTFFAFPALLFLGIPPIAANATCTIAVWPGSLASVYGYRSALQDHLKNIPWMIALAFIGGWIGAQLLLHTPEATFEFLIPWLLLGATLLFARGPALAKQLGRLAGTHQARWRWGVSTMLLGLISIYGGYFGAGIGILLLAMLQMLGMEQLHRMNALKTVLSSATNASAVLAFILSGNVNWPAAIVMLAGGIVGGYGGAKLGLFIPAAILRRFVIVVGSVMSLVFFGRYYL